MHFHYYDLNKNSSRIFAGEEDSIKKKYFKTADKKHKSGDASFNNLIFEDFFKIESGVSSRMWYISTIIGYNEEKEERKNIICSQMRVFPVNKLLVKAKKKIF